jgi:hypothetical protein
MKASAAFVTPPSGLALELIRPYLADNPTGPIFQMYRHDLPTAAGISWQSPA